ncbi:MAG: hypothetical protein KA746_14050 [Pyrinomonadaceae bacterium]|nr:hypothetical protein [Pyrinomonadaceae bacterium]MBP6211816.1 hypothetical protein [Pyrinomonadaceae bacterium]
MNCKIIAIENFRREAKRLHKKYASLKGELSRLGEELLQDPRLGKPLGKSVYKIRLAVKSKGRGKSGGLRIITRIVEVQFKVVDSPPQTNIYLLSIYDKAEQPDITDKRLKEIIDDIA